MREGFQSSASTDGGVTTPAPNDDEDRDKGTDFPRLKGQCPACGNETLFRGSKGYITCSWLKCSNPGAAHDAMVRRQGQPMLETATS